MMGWTKDSGPGGKPVQIEKIDRLRQLGRDTGEQDLLLTVVTKFRREAAQSRAQFRSSLATGDLVAIERIAHTLLGSAAVFGANRLVEICGELETCARNGDEGGCRVWLPPLDAALSEVLSVLLKLESL